jgi:hypothetical protein
MSGWHCTISVMEGERPLRGKSTRSWYRDRMAETRRSRDNDRSAQIDPNRPFAVSPPAWIPANFYITLPAQEPDPVPSMC